MNSIILKLIIRDLVKNKFYSFITIFGLAIGMAVTILIYIYSQHEFSYDSFHKNADRIFRVNSILTQDKKEIYPICIRLADSVLQKQVPEIDEIFQFYNIGPTEIISDNKRFKDIPAICSDENIYKVFTLNFLQGNPENALSKPYTVVLTKSIALKIFGAIDIVGKTLKESNDIYTITAVIEDFPPTSHLKIGAIASMSSIKYMDMLRGMEFGTYILFNDKVNLTQSVKKAKDAYSYLLSERFKESGYKMDCHMQSLRDIHLKSDFNSKSGFDAPVKKIYMYLSLALVVLLIAIINFINLLTAQYEGKSKEIGVQKAIGASRFLIAKQFFGKSLIFSCIALVIACILVESLIPSFGNLFHRDLIGTYRNASSLFVILPLLALFVGLFSGLYPALFISKFPPNLAIKGEVHSHSGTNVFTKALVIVQFAISIFLISSLIVINNQIKFMKNADLGFNAKRVIAISNMNEKLVQSYPAIKDALSKVPEIKIVSASDHILGGGVSGQGVRIVGQMPSKDYSMNEYRVLGGFFETFEFKFIMGRPFDERIQSDRQGIIFNEAAIRMLGLSDPLNTQVEMHDFSMPILGVVKDFHYASFEENIEPIAFTYYRNYPRHILIKIENDNITQILPRVESIIKEFDSGYEMDYIVMDDLCRNRYGAQEQTETLSSIATILSLILALLGLYALAMFMVQKRTKEIGIRKVNGASRFQIVKLLLKVYSSQVFIAFIIAAPIAYIVLDKWLNDFAYKIALTPLPFVFAGLMAFAVAILTVASQTWHAAGRNPLESLRYE